MKICRKYFCLIIVAGMLLLSGCDSSDYKKAVDLYVNGDYAEACIIFSALGEYEDSRNLVTSCRYHLAKADLEKGNYSEACSAFSELGDYEDCSGLVTLCLYNLALEDMNNGEFLKAYDQFSQLGDYLDSAACLTKAKWGLLYQYVQENGAYSAKTGKNAISQKIKSSDSKADYTMYLSMPDSDMVSLSSTYSTSDSGYTITRDFSINLEYGNTEAEWNCSLVIKISVLGVTGERLEDGSGEVDISTFKSSTSMKLSSYSGTNKSIQGVKSTISKSDEAVTSAANKALVEIKSNLVSLLKGTDIGITVEELGF